MTARPLLMLFALSAAALAGCGNGGPRAEGGISGSGVTGMGVSMGPVTGFGSLHLNGIRLEVTSNTQIVVGGVPGSQSDLRVGQVLRVEADFDNSTAEHVEYYELVRGPIEDVTIDNPETLQATLTVLGQVVHTAAATNFENFFTPDELAPGELVEVSGTRDAQGAILATFIARRASLASYRLTGRVSNLAGTSFQIAGLSVDFSGADTSALTNPLPQDGELLRVTADPGGYSAPPPALLATRLEPGLALAPVVDDSIDTQGFVTRFASLSDFDLDGQPVNGTAAVVDDGVDLALNARLQVQGTVDDGGVLQATRIAPRNEEFVRLEALVESLGAEQQLTLLGVNVTVAQQARIEDQRSGGGGSLQFADLNAGDYLRVRGFLDGGLVTATRIELEDPAPRAELLAPLGAADAAAGRLTLLGLTIAAAAPDTEFQDLSNALISQSEFYMLLGPDTLVKVRWDPFSSTAAPVKEASIESE